MMWFTPLVGGTAVVLVSIVVAAPSARPVLALQPMVVFTRRYTDSRQPFCKGKRLG
jgi:putative ABC transport system permease protein